MSESERMPGYRNRSQVPPMAPRLSSTAYVRPGKASWMWYAAPMPDSPAPMISTSTWSVTVFSRRSTAAQPVGPSAGEAAEPGDFGIHSVDACVREHQVGTAETLDTGCGCLGHRFFFSGYGDHRERAVAEIRG